MYIGKVAEKTGLSVKAIRFYEEKGLIKTPSRQGRYRVYQISDIEILNMIKEAKEMGVTLAQLKGVIVYQNGQIDWHRIKSFLQEVKRQLLDRMAELEAKIKKIDDCCQQIGSPEST